PCSPYMPMEIFPMNSQKHRRQRAVILTSQDFDRLQAPKAEVESYEIFYQDCIIKVESDRTDKEPDNFIKGLVKQILDRVGAIVVEIAGEVQFMTQRAEELLSQYFLHHIPYSLPESLQHWFQEQIARIAFNHNVPSRCLPLHIQQAGKQLIVRLIPDPIKEQYVLLLEEEELQSFSISALESLGLTKREAEVLFWIAKDKSNAGIAKVLGCSEGTVRKHLEHLYGKLSVQTRTAAVMVALEKLGWFNGKFFAISS
ncbi:helix-turn-helix transcriptional regulator, partial [Microcoleus sp. Pol12B4]|uniref:helix-turn-helix transcriptional regulator n=1 Tax=Microcoleus sp. Pol12B4 TaxID=3055395 RepID=UPI002FCFDEC2